MPRYDPTRWICQTRPENCDGQFCVYGALRPCPLAEKCMDPAQKYTPLEYGYEKIFNGYRNQYYNGDPIRYLAHAKRSSILRRAFLGDELKEKARAYNRDQYYNGGKREAYALRHQKKLGHIPKYYNSQQSTVLPPCGGDCLNCPYEKCAYPNFDEEQTGEKARNRRNSLKYLERLRADPERYAVHLEKRRKSGQARRDRKKEGAENHG